MNDFQNRARQTLIGMAIGDAVSWPSMFHRSRLLPAWTRRLRREIDLQRESASVLRVPMPFSLNQPPEYFDLFPTDDTEWAAWTMQNLLRHNFAMNQEWVEREWSALARNGAAVLGAVSTQAALDNLRNGVRPPASGGDNPHYFDDGAICRAVPIGVAFSGNPEAAANAAAIDAHVTNSEDGVFVASATAAAISAACSGANAQVVVDTALRALPATSWAKRTADTARTMANQHHSLLTLLPALHGIMNVEYSDGCAGPETLAISLALVSMFGGDFERAVSASTLIAKGADAVPATVGALSGAIAQKVDGHEAWTPLSVLRGVCLPSLAGVNFHQLVDEFVTACSSSKKQ